MKHLFQPDIPPNEKDIIISYLNDSLDSNVSGGSKLLPEAILALLEILRPEKPTFNPFWLGAFGGALFEIREKVPITYFACGALYGAMQGWIKEEDNENRMGV